MSQCDLRILIAEDEKTMSYVLKRRVKELQAYFPSAQIEVSLTIDEAARIIRRNPPPDVVLLDLSFPDSNMEQTLARLDEFESRSAVVLVTGMDKGRIEEIIGTRVVEIVRKGREVFEPSFFDTIARAVNYRKSRVVAEELSRCDEILAKFNAIGNATG